MRNLSYLCQSEEEREFVLVRFEWQLMQSPGNLRKENQY
jgi:recombinational DNA repair protein (RecF pathway)